MKKSSVIIGLVMVFVLLAVAPAAAEISQEGEERPETLVLGMVPSREAGRMIESIDPLTDLLEEELGIPVEGTVLTSFTGVIEAMGSGRVDIGIFGPFALVLGEDRHDLEIILNSIRYGSDHYMAQFVVREDSGIDEIADLEDKTVAFVDPASASGYLFTYVHLMNHGIDPDTDLADYIFAGAHDASMIAVMTGEVDAGVSFDDAREDIEAEFPNVMEETKILAYTEPIPNDGIAVRRELHPELTKAIQDAFVAVGETEEGRELLDTLYNVSGFVPATSERYNVVRETFEIMEEYIDF